MYCSGTACDPVGSRELGGSTGQQQMATKRREVEAETLPAPREQLQDRRESRAQGLDPWQPWELRRLSKLPGQHAAQLLVGLQISTPVGFYFFLHGEEQHDPAVCTHHWSQVAELFRHPVFDLC